VRDNVLFANEQGRPVFGGFATASAGCATAIHATTPLGNDTLGAGLRRALDPVRRGQRRPEQRLLRDRRSAAHPPRAATSAITSTTTCGSLPAAPRGALRLERRGAARGFAAYGARPAGRALDRSPILVADAGAGHSTSPRRRPAINAGDAATPASGEDDLDGAPRVSGPRVDVGRRRDHLRRRRDQPGEECDDANSIDGDGCDSNCTTTRCGNGIVSAGEACDDGGLTPATAATRLSARTRGVIL
jgi:cysteine-rich repeat protein